jgi:hypothetical protein
MGERSKDYPPIALLLASELLHLPDKPAGVAPKVRDPGITLLLPSF